MKQINFRVASESYKILKENIPCSVPAFFTQLANDFVSKLNAGVTVNGWELDSIIVDYNEEPQNNSLKTWVTESQKNALENHAKKHGWSISREIRHRLQTTLSNRLDMFDEELHEFRRARNDLNKLALNMNAILRKDDGRIIDKNGFMEDVKNLQQKIDGLQERLDRYMLLSNERQKKNRVV